MEAFKQEDLIKILTMTRRSEKRNELVLSLKDDDKVSVLLFLSRLFHLVLNIKFVCGTNEAGGDEIFYPSRRTFSSSLMAKIVRKSTSKRKLL